MNVKKKNDLQAVNSHASQIDLLERVQGISDAYGDVAQGSLLAGAVEQIHIALGGSVEFNHPAHVVAALCMETNQDIIN